MISFINLHHHDSFSLRCALGDVKDVIAKTKQFNQQTFAITNYNQLSGWVQQYFECRKQNIKPILAVQMMVSNYRVNYEQDKKTISSVDFLGAKQSKTMSLQQMTAAEKVAIGVNWHLLLYAKNEEGYFNIIKIHNDAQLHGIYEHPRTTNKFLSEHGKGVVCVIPSVNGEVINDIENDREKFAIVKYRGYKNIFEEVYLELTIAEDDYYIEENNKVIQFAQKYNIPLVISINSHYINKDDEAALKALMSIKKGGDVRKEVNVCPNMSLKSTEEIYELFERKFKNDIFTLEVFEEAIKNNKKLADSIDDFELNTDIKMPKYPNAEEVLRQKAWEGLRNRGKADDPRYVQRLKYELDNVIKAGFADYFLFLEDVCRYCHENGIKTGTGRGCFTPDSKVLLDNNIEKEIQDIKVGDIVISAEGTKEKVLDKYIYDIDQDICVVEIENGVIIKCTKDHKFLIAKKYYNNIEYVWEYAKNLVGEYVVNSLDNNITYQVKKISVEHYKGKVIDLCVENKHTYNINNIAVHNSGGGCIVLYALHIFEVDPVKYNLLFERFLDANRLNEIVNKGGKVSGCFTLDTLVRTVNGAKPIGDIKIGEKVITKNGEIKQVKNIFDYNADLVIRIVYEDKYYFDCTPNHEILTLRNNQQKYVHAHELQVGDLLVQFGDKPIKLVFIAKSPTTNNTVRDLEIQDNHNYIICGKPINEVVFNDDSVGYYTDKQIENLN